MEKDLVTTQKSEKNKTQIICAVKNLENALLKTNKNQELLLTEISKKLSHILEKL